MMKVERVTYFDQVAAGDILIYEADSTLQEQAERGKVISANPYEFVVEWQYSPEDDNHATFYVSEDPEYDWELYRVLND